jgi:hypothetical protein
MLSAPEAFMAVSNATAAVVRKEPPYVTCRVHGLVQGVGQGTSERVITVRTDDGMAVVRDDAGKEELRPAYPASPAFDALAQFEMFAQVTIAAGKGPHRKGDMRITNVHPLHYETAASHADAVSRAVKGYVVTYADDSSAAAGHLHLERNAAFGAGTKWLRDVWYDPATLIPSRVIWGGQNDLSLDARYQVVEGHWLLSSLNVSAIVHAPLWLGRTTVFLNNDFEGYQFSDVPPDPRLAPNGQSQPAPSTTRGNGALPG